MEGKLIKTKSTYHLVVNNKIIGSMGDSDGKLHKLSLKNCDAIANGYDLIKLIEENSKYSEEDWGDGFLFAMNLMSDKKFSEEHLKVAADWYYETKGKKSIDEYIQSLQPKEWDVEIETILIQSSIEGESIWEPKLDSDGCLILKRK